MANKVLTQQVMALPLAERVALAEALWESIDVPAEVDHEERQALEDALRRDQELSDGAVEPRTHEQVMAAARRAIGCD
ncbi:MAG TPA: addiction module protein [Thermoanaerobaculia bacterium]|nr:addiction module protein [Thermoanaerobaculia bacterium]